MLQYLVWLLIPCFLLAQTEIFHEHAITTTYDPQERPLSILISDIGEIRYDYSMEGGKIYRFSPTGELLYSSSYTPTVVLATHPHLINTPTAWTFSSKHYDPELNLIYFGHRYYDPSLRQWLTPDPLAINNTDLYTYCFNDPLHYIYSFQFKVPGFRAPKPRA